MKQQEIFMSDDDNSTLPTEKIESFSGKVYMLKNGHEIPLRLSRTQDKFSWTGAAENDWLQAGGTRTPPVLNFTYHSQTSDRWHFLISGSGPDAEKKLGISRNGYLGLYEVAEVHDYWKIEPLRWIEKGLICHLRDHKGHQVKAELDLPHVEPGAFYLLTVADGEPLEFLIKRTN